MPHSNSYRRAATVKAKWKLDVHFTAMILKCRSLFTMAETDCSSSWKVLQVFATLANAAQSKFDIAMHTIREEQNAIIAQKSTREKWLKQRVWESFQKVMCVANSFTWHFCNSTAQSKQLKCNLVLVPRHNRQLVQNYSYFVNTLFSKYKKDQRKG